MWATTTPTTSPVLLTAQGPCMALGLLSPITGMPPLDWLPPLSHPKGFTLLTLRLAGSQPNIRCGSMTDKIEIKVDDLISIRRQLLVVSLAVRAESDRINALIGGRDGYREEPHG